MYVAAMGGTGQIPHDVPVPPVPESGFGNRELNTFKWDRRSNCLWCKACDKKIEVPSVYNHIMYTATHKKKQHKVSKEDFATWLSYQDWLNDKKNRMPIRFYSSSYIERRTRETHMFKQNQTSDYPRATPTKR
jgi:hypothetical protein